MRPTQTTPPEVAAVIDRMKQEILADITAGIVPATVASFSELHDYVDANEYGGACEQDGPFEGFTTEQVDFWNNCQTACDEWLRNGRVNPA